jgi:stage II sporulation protein R
MKDATTRAASASSNATPSLGPSVAPSVSRRQRRRPLPAAVVAGMLTLTGAAVPLLAPLAVRGAPILRLRIVAASDRPADQALKREVRDAVVAELAPVIGGARTLGQARALARAHLSDVRAVARSVVGPGVPVRVRLGPDAFPARRLGFLRFPAGEYDTLLVTLGAGRGHNWWTVLFPPFAFVRLGRRVAVVGPDRAAAEPAFRLHDPDAEGPVTVVGDGSPAAAPVEMRFALWDVWRAALRDARRLAAGF